MIEPELLEIAAAELIICDDYSARTKKIKAQNSEYFNGKTLGILFCLFFLFIGYITSPVLFVLFTAVLLYEITHEN